MLHTIADERAPLSRITAATTVDVRFPTSEQLDGSDAMNPDPDYSAAYLSARHRRRRRSGRGRLRVHHRPRQQHRGRGHPDGGRHARRRVGRGPARRHGRDLPTLRLRLAPALARTGEGRHAHGHRRRGQRAVGSQGQARRSAAVAARLGDVTRGARRPRRLPLPDRRAHTRRGAGDLRQGRPRPRGAHRPAAASTAIPPTRPHRAGSATPTRRWCGSPARPSRRASPRSSSRSAAASTTTSDVCPWRAPRSVRTSRSPSTPTSAGTSARRSPG